MEWPTKILKGSSNIGQYYGKYGDDRTWDVLRYSEDDSSGFDREEIDYATALSLSEVDRKGKKEIGFESGWGEDLQCIESDSEEDERKAKAQQEVDEQLARAQQVEEALRAQAQVEEDEQLAKAIQEISNEYESDSEEDLQCIESDWAEDERQARAQQEEDTRRTRAQQEEDARRAKAQLEEDARRAKAQVEEDARRAKAQVEEDEQLAKAIQQSLSMESPPQYDKPFSNRICSGCNTEIGHGQYLSYRGAVWHPECFRCHACSQPITDIEFSMSKNRPYHKHCYREQGHPKCDVCHNFIPTNSAGLIEYRAHPFWMQKYCPSHERDGTTRCCSCERMEPRDLKYLLLDDGRKLCLECLDSALLDTHECQPLYLEIQGFYEGLNMKLEQQVPLLLVERQALNEAMEGEKNGHHHLPETRGLCLSEEQTVTTVLRRPRIGTGYRLIDMITEPHRLIRRCEVTAILILYGLPRLLTGTILAHEMMHAWLRLKGYPNLKPEVEEGICQVLAHMWLESEIYSGSGRDVASSSTSSKKGKRSDSEKDLGKFFKHQIESDSSSAYGDGFREGNKAVHKYGLRSTLDHIGITGSFPC